LTDVKIVEEKAITLWETVPVIEQQTITETVRLESDEPPRPFAEFENESIVTQGNLNIASGSDVYLSSLITADGAKSNLTITAGGNITNEGMVPDDADADTIAARSKLDVSGDITLRATMDVTLARSSDTTSGGNVLIEAQRAAKVEGTLAVDGSVGLTAGTNLGIDGSISSGESMDLVAGLGSALSGDISGGLYTDITINAGLQGALTLTAGTEAGDILIDNSVLNASGSMVLEAAAGHISHSNGTLTTADMTVTALSGITLTLDANRIDASITSRLRCSPFGR